MACVLWRGKAFTMSRFVPTEEQKALLDADVSALVIAGPGTGKTRTAIEKARLTVHTLPSESHKVLFLSFSNAAVFRLAESAKAELTRTERKRISFRTYHAFAAEILRSYGRFVGIPPIFRIMDTLEEKLLLIEEGVSPTSERYQEFLYKKAREGLLAFATLIPLATRLLTSSERLRRIVGRNYPLIIVDEFQDTSEEQWQFLRVVGQYSQVVAFGDPNQIIYAGMHEATEKRMDEFRDWKGVVPVTFSERHFRFGSPEILVFAEALLKGKKYHSKDDSGVYLYDLEFRTKDRHRLRTALALIWKSIRNDGNSNETIGYFAFSNALAEEIAVTLRNPPSNAKVSFPVYARLTRDEAAYDAVLLALAALKDFAEGHDTNSCRRCAVALMAMNSAWNKRAATSAKRLDKFEGFLKKSLGTNSKLGQLMTELTSAHSLDHCVPKLVEVFIRVDGFKSSCKRISAHGKLHLPTLPQVDAELPLFDQIRSSRVPKGLEGYDAGRGHTQVLNYHRTKGREFDHVVMLVDPRAESSKIKLDELRRLYYVCATRARSTLVVLYYGKEKGRVLGPVI